LPFLSRLRRWFQPTLFPGDEVRSTQARILNAAGLYLVGAILAALLFFLPAFASRWAETLSVILMLGAVILISRRIMFRGNLPLAAGLMVFAGWAVVMGLAFAAGGIGSAMMFAATASSIVGAIVLESPMGFGLVVLSAAAALVMAVLEQAGVPLPRHYDFPPLSEWFLFALSLLFINRILSVTVRSLRESLSGARRQAEALREAYRVVEASGGAEALGLCSARTDPIDLVLTDLVMPEMSGSAFVERLRRDGMNLKVLSMSGNADRALSLPGRQEGADIPVLPKPFTLGELARAVRAVLDGN
jgi:CheY-like chemotaxis protein